METFHDGLAWVAQLAMFLTLGLLVFPDALGPVAIQGTVLALLAAVVARPLAALIATTGAGFDLRERAVLGWAGPARRGARRARDLPGHRGRAAQRGVLRHRVLRRARLDGPAGHDLRGARAAGWG